MNAPCHCYIGPRGTSAVNRQENRRGHRKWRKRPRTWKRSLKRPVVSNSTAVELKLLRVYYLTVSSGSAPPPVFFSVRVAPAPRSTAAQRLTESRSTFADRSATKYCASAAKVTLRPCGEARLSSFMVRDSSNLGALCSPLVARPTQEPTKS